MAKQKASTADGLATPHFAGTTATDRTQACEMVRISGSTSRSNETMVNASSSIGCGPEVSLGRVLGSIYGYLTSHRPASSGSGLATPTSGGISSRRGMRRSSRENPHLPTLLALVDDGPMTLLYGAKNEEHNQAVVLQEILNGR